MKQLRDWLQAFEACPVTALYSCPDDVYSVLRGRGLVDIEHDVTPLAKRWMRRNG